jgi:hypothetical protein
MAYCSFALQEWQVCLRDIEAALTVHTKNTHYEFLKIKALAACYGQSKSWEGEIIEECLKMLKSIEIERIGDLNIDPQSYGQLQHRPPYLQILHQGGAGSIAQRCVAE